MNDEPRIDGPGRREQRRRAINQKFVLHHHAVGQQACYTRDLSLSGAFVTGSFSGVYPGDTVELEFDMGSGTGSTHRFSASVVRVEPGGVGLKFLSLDMDTYGALLDLTLSV
jgi:hypothetical protein